MCNNSATSNYFLDFQDSTVADAKGITGGTGVYTFITDANAILGWDDTGTALGALIYETVSDSYVCKYQIPGTPSTVGTGALNIKTGYCGADTVTTLSSGVRVGGELIYNSAEIDFDTDECRIGISWLDPATYQSPYDAAVATWDPATELCDSTFNLKDAFVSVKNPKKTIIDLIKFKCYLPEDCIPRPLEIDYNRWTTAGIDKATDKHLYHCIMESPHHSVRKEHNQKTAKDYVLIGDPTTI